MTGNFNSENTISDFFYQFLRFIGVIVTVVLKRQRMRFYCQLIWMHKSLCTFDLFELRDVLCYKWSSE